MKSSPAIRGYVKLCQNKKDLLQKKDSKMSIATSTWPFLFYQGFSKCQIDGEDFGNSCGLLRKHKLY